MAADVADENTQAISDFAFSALKHGMVYFCSWGPDCERFHDIVDEVIVEDDIGDRRFAGLNKSDVIMTTWHAKDSLEEAIDFFATCAMPTDGFAPDSDFRLVVCVSNQQWTAQATKFLQPRSSWFEPSDTAKLLVNAVSSIWNLTRKWPDKWTGTRLTGT